MKKIIALTVAMAAATGANAAWDYGTSNQLNENGELLFFMFDENPANKISGAQDLGIRYDDMRAVISSNSFSVTFNLNESVFNNFNSITNTSTLRWGVMGFSQGFLDADYGMMLTSAVQNPTYNAGKIDDALAKQPNFISRINVNGDTNFDNDNATYGTAANNRYLGDNSALGRSIGNSQFFDLTAGIEQQLAFYHFYDDFTATGFRQEFTGKWSLDLASKTLTYSVETSQVPVPAAAWLMGSALVGLTGITRRRNHK